MTQSCYCSHSTGQGLTGAHVHTGACWGLEESELTSAGLTSKSRPHPSSPLAQMRLFPRCTERSCSCIFWPAGNGLRLTSTASPCARAGSTAFCGGLGGPWIGAPAWDKSTQLTCAVVLRVQWESMASGETMKLTQGRERTGRAPHGLQRDRRAPGPPGTVPSAHAHSDPGSRLWALVFPVPAAGGKWRAAIGSAPPCTGSRAGQ